jgi:hypothetical protein
MRVERPGIRIGRTRSGCRMRCSHRITVIPAQADPKGRALAWKSMTAGAPGI